MHPNADHIATTIAALADHAEAHGLRWTSTGVTITPEWEGWTVRATLTNAAGGELDYRFTEEDMDSLCDLADPADRALRAGFHYAG